MLADFRQIALGLVGMFGARKTMEFVQFDVLGLNVVNDRPVSRRSLVRGAFNPPLDGSGMDALDPGHRLRAQALKALPQGALDFVCWCLEVVAGRPVTVTESLLALPAAEDLNHLTAPQ